MDAIARVLSPTSGGSTVLRKGTRSFCRSLTLACQNSPCWRSCERCISFLSSRSPWAAIADSAQSIDASAHGPHVACALIGMCCNTYALSSSCNRLQRGYQECGCPSNQTNFIVDFCMGSPIATHNIIFIFVPYKPLFHAKIHIP